MRKEMLIRMHTSSEKGNSKAIKVAAAITGVESVTIAGEDRNLLLVIGVGIDSNRITEKLRRKVGHVEVVELRSVDAEELAAREFIGEQPYRYHPSPYKHGGAGAARNMYYAGGGGYGAPRTMAAGGARERYYTGGGSMYAPEMAGGARGYYYGPGAGGYPAYPALYQQQPAPASTHTVVHHEYASDPNSCSVM